MIADNLSGVHWALLLVQFLMWNSILNIETDLLKRSKNFSFSFLSRKLLLTFFQTVSSFQGIFLSQWSRQRGVRIPNRREAPNFISMAAADCCFLLCIASCWLALHHHSLTWVCLYHSQLCHGISHWQWKITYKYNGNVRVLLQCLTQTFAQGQVPYL